MGADRAHNQGKVDCHAVSFKLLFEHTFAVLIHTVHLEHVIGQINSNGYVTVKCGNLRLHRRSDDFFPHGGLNIHN